MSKENYLRLTSTLENLEKLEKKVISSRNKESALKKNIDKQANTILDTENIFNKLGTKVSNFDEKMSKLVVRKSRQVANVDKAEKNLSEFNDEHFQGKDAHTFEVNHSLVKKAAKMNLFYWFLEERIGIIMGILFISCAMGATVSAWYIFPQPLFVCDDGSAELQSYDVLDGENHCDDGSDEATSPSSWTFEDDTRAEKFERSDEHTKAIFRECGFGCGVGLIVAFLPFLLKIYFDKRSDKLNSKFYSKYGSDINESERLKQIRESAIKKLTEIKHQISSLKSKRSEHQQLEEDLMIYKDEQNELNDKLQRLQSTIAQTEERINENWSSIADLIPYGTDLQDL